MRMFSKLTDINVVLCKTESKVQNIIQTVQLLNQTFFWPFGLKISLFFFTWNRVSTCSATLPVQGKNNLNLSVWVGTMPSVEMLTEGLAMALLGACMKVILYGIADPFLASHVKSIWSTSAGITWKLNKSTLTRRELVWCHIRVKHI